jgi:hypothetical protein
VLDVLLVQAAATPDPDKKILITVSHPSDPDLATTAQACLATALQGRSAALSILRHVFSGEVRYSRVSDLFEGLMMAEAIIINCEGVTGIHTV